MSFEGGEKILDVLSLAKVPKYIVNIEVGGRHGASFPFRLNCTGV